MIKRNLGLKTGIILAALISFSAINIYGEISKQLPHTMINGTDCLVYEVKKGESLYGIAKKYGWSYDELLKYNPRIVGEVKKGEKIYYPSAPDMFLRHEVGKGETVYSISKDYNVPIDSIYKYNPSLQKGIKKGDIIFLVNELAHKNITSIVEEVVEPEIIQNELGENYQIVAINDNFSISIPNSVIGLPDEPLINGKPFDGVRLAVVLDEAKSKKDIDFTRGVLVALNEMKETPYKINMKVINGKDTVDNIVGSLDTFSPNLIFTTADKNFPQYLLDYGQNHDAQIVNVFYLKSNESNHNINVIQILPPSAYYNDMVASWIFGENEDRKLFFVGAEDPNDGIASELTELFGLKEVLTPQEFSEAELVPNEIGKLVIYSCATKKEDIIAFLDIMGKMTEKYPELDYILIGRSNWISWKDELKDQFGKFNVYIPSRVWLDENSEKWSDFVSKYSNLFSAKPVKSFPNFAASGYDMASYFIPVIAELKGDYSHGFRYSQNLLQTDIQLYKENDKSGYQNDVSYMIKFMPEGKYEKILVK